MIRNVEHKSRKRVGIFHRNGRAIVPFHIIDQKAPIALVVTKGYKSPEIQISSEGNG